MIPTGYTDTRKGFPSLALQVQEILHRDRLSGHGRGNLKVSNSVICCPALIRGIRRRRGGRHQSGKFLLADGDDCDSVAGVTALCLILAATMSQKSSVPQTAKFVSGALKRNTAAALTSGRIGRRQIGKIAALSRYSNRSAQATDAQ